MVWERTVETVKELVTADELWQMSSQGENYELVRGELIEMAPPGGEQVIPGFSCQAAEIFG